MRATKPSAKGQPACRLACYRRQASSDRTNGSPQSRYRPMSHVLAVSRSGLAAAPPHQARPRANTANDNVGASIVGGNERQGQCGTVTVAANVLLEWMPMQRPCAAARVWSDPPQPRYRWTYNGPAPKVTMWLQRALLQTLFVTCKKKRGAPQGADRSKSELGSTWSLL